MEDLGKRPGPKADSLVKTIFFLSWPVNRQLLTVWICTLTWTKMNLFCGIYYNVMLVHVDQY